MFVQNFLQFAFSGYLKYFSIFSVISLLLGNNPLYDLGNLTVSV